MFLEDFSGMTHDEVVQKIQADFEVSLPSGIEILVAYMHVGNWGCDSSAFIVFKHSNRMYEVHGSHCSCNGFEGQWEPEETTVEAILDRPMIFYTGGYDLNSDGNKKAIRKFISGLESKEEIK